MAILHWYILSAVYVFGSMKYMDLWTRKNENGDKKSVYSFEEKWSGNENVRVRMRKWGKFYKKEAKQKIGSELYTQK